MANQASPRRDSGVMWQSILASLLLAILWMRADGVNPAGVEAAFGGASFAAQLDAALRVRDEPPKE